MTSIRNRRYRALDERVTPSNDNLDFRFDSIALVSLARSQDPRKSGSIIYYYRGGSVHDREIQNYFEKLERLSIAELDRSAEKLVVAEHGNIARLIAHIAEMSARKAALELGYKNLFDYCVRRLNLSEGAVPARMHVANVSRKFPQLLAALAENEISLTVASLLAPHVNEDNVDQLISDCAGKTRKATEEYLVAIKPKPVFEPSIRRVPERAATSPPPEPKAPPAPRPAPPTKSSPPVLEPARPEVFNFRFAADREFKDKLERLAEVLGVENPQQNMAKLFEKALDIALDKKDPKKKLERRQKREKAKSRSNEIPRNEHPATSRYIPSEVSERVHARGDYRCEHRGPGGTRCPSRTGLQMEHVRPFGIYRSHDERFLKLLCPQHNRLAAERVYGAGFIQRKIDERRGTVVRE